MRTIVKKERVNPNNPTIGYVTPVFVEDNNRWIPIIDLKKQFPNNECIFVHRGYDTINTKFGSNELFVLSCETNTNHRPDNEGSSQWSTTGDKAQAPINNEFCRILNSSRSFDANREYWIWQNDSPLNDIFLKTNEYLYGPFNFSSKKDEDEDGVNLLLKAEADHGYCIFKVKVSDAEKKLHIYQEGNYQYLISVDALLNDEQVFKEGIYYGSATDLLDWAKKIIDESIISDVNKLKKAVDAITSQPSLEEVKLKKLKSLLSNSHEWFAKRLPTFISQYLEENPIGIKKVQDYLKINEQLQPDSKNELKQLREALEQAEQQKNENLKDTRIEALPELERKFIDQLLDDVNLRQQYMQIQLLDKHVHNLEVDREVKKRLIDETDKDLKEKQHLKDGLEKSLKKLKENFSNTEEVRSKFFDIKPYVDWINGIIPVTSDEDQKAKVNKLLDSLKLKQDVLPLKEYLNEVTQNLHKLDRQVEYNELANYLISINQNFLTVFAGLPGVGKTSLITKLAIATGLQNRFLPVSTARGWTSQRDLIGYYNAISNQFQPARTGLFDVLQICDIGVRNGIDIPYWILLDEANLSPMEHYWSDFMRFSDPESERILRIPKGNDQDELYIGQGLRFIATVNYDHTTEAFSPRLLDRISVIRLTASQDLIKIAKPIVLPLPEDYFSTIQLEQILNPTNTNFEMAGGTLNLFNEIRLLLENEEEDTPIIINPRKQRDISKFCTIAQHIFEDNGNQFNALDYAFNQQVLPLVAGRGEKFGKRLTDLYDLINTYLPMSSISLRRIIKNGENNYYNYRFFV
ncbi:hypothetical protein [Larkinella terrae]|uniref:AAA domain-containing protein n=1 Tax=Larkinella terrae TaxID=2025311 RepID=A0A7K0EDJ6_9BACT|nr:hypothetical protein [Larkinella terrae]MRS59802.1 hypothetical protein [Larkinella terrae]